MIIGPPSSTPQPGRDGSATQSRMLSELLAERSEERASSSLQVPASSFKPREPKVNLPAGPVGKVLKPHQKTELSMLAKAAYRRAQLCHATDGLSEKDWRHRESIKAAGVRISEAEQRHYNLIKAHFQLLTGETGKAFGTHLREHGSGLRIAQHKLNAELAKHGLSRDYVAKIAANKFKGLALDHCSEKQTWSLVYDLRRVFTKGKQAKRAAKQARTATKPGEPEPF